MPLVSVLMGTYNEPDREQLQTAVDSILGQTFKDFEYIICDDGSNMEFYQWLKTVCVKDARIRLLRNQKNHGLAYTLNRCFHCSSGKYLARMDADDISLPDRLAKQAAFLEKNSNYALTGCNVGMIDENCMWGIRELNERPDRCDFLYTSPFVHPAVMMRREVMDRLCGYSEGEKFLRVEDYDFFMRVYEAGYAGYNLQEILFLYREGLSSYRKRKYRFRMKECLIRYAGFQRLGILRGNMRYVLKPLAVGLIPAQIMRIYRVQKFEQRCPPVRLESLYPQYRAGKENMS